MTTGTTGTTGIRPPRATRTGPTSGHSRGARLPLRSIRPSHSIRAGRSLRSAALVAAASLLALTVAGCGGSPGRHQGDTAGQDGATTRAERAHGTQRPFTLVATGDILSHDSVIRQAREDAAGPGSDPGPRSGSGSGSESGSGTRYDFREMLSGARSLAAGADVALCHMETVYGPAGGPFTGYPAFKTPPEVAAGIKDTGYDSCSTASNHTLDAGSDGIRRTLTAMDRAGLKHVGSARSARERTRFALLRAGGARIAQLSYTYGTNGIPVPKKKPWSVNLLDPKRIIADARAARRAGADIVVVSTHWGTEWQQAPDQRQLSVARQLTRSRSHGRKDIDLVIGTHAHVPQAYEKVNGTWVVYGMGDLLAGQMNDPRGAMSSAARFTFAPPGPGDRRGVWKVRKAEWIPFHVQTSAPIRTVDVGPPAAHADGAGAEAYRTIRKAVLSRGAAQQGLRQGR